MAAAVDWLLEGIDSFLAWISFSLKQSMDAYCDIETADSDYNLVAHDGSFVSVIRIHGNKGLLGPDEFELLHDQLTLALQSSMSRPGHALQVFFNYDRDTVTKILNDILEPAKNTAQRLELDLEDVFSERVKQVGNYCAEENVFFVLWTRPSYLTDEQLKRANKSKMKASKDNKVPPFRYTQNIMAAVPDLRDAHDSFTSALLNDLNGMGIYSTLLPVHEAIYEMRKTVDANFTNTNWRPVLPGDTMQGLKQYDDFASDVSTLMWPPLAKQLLPRDAENLDLRTCRIGDKIYSTIFIDLFPKDIKTFVALLRRTLQTQVPWRLSFMLESDGLPSIRFKQMLTTILSFASPQNRLISDAGNLLKYISINSDDAIVRLKVAAATWAPEDDIQLLRLRSAELAKAIQGWGGCDVSEVSGDAFAGVVSSMMGITKNSVAIPSVARLSDVTYMLPITRPASPWQTGAILFRTPDGKPWPFQPGSSQQTTWIDLMYARPGSGKSVLSNTINLALCLSAGLRRLPRIAIIDIGPSSSGLVSLLQEALPPEKRHFVAYHRLRMTPDYAINPFDTELGCRYPTPQERSFLVNFLTLLATPLGSQRPYDAIPDLAGMVVNELYKLFSDENNPTVYSPGMEPLLDGLLEEIGFVRDSRSTWWEVTDALFAAGFSHEAMLAQRYATPLLADAGSICRSTAVEDLYGGISVPTGENIITAFSRMISAAIREYPILSKPTCFDLGEARVVSLDLDEVAKSGGDAADRQTAVMYMLARHVLARHYYLTEESVENMPEQYKDFHRQEIRDLREDPKRIVYDEFHRTAKASAVREQVLIDMREGRKWNVQIALISQAVDDFDDVMIDFATSIYIMDAGPGQSIDKTSEIFDLSPTAKIALRTRVHGPRQGGATFLAQFATKEGMQTQLLTNTLGPMELWAFSTTVEDAQLRNQLYKKIGPKEARRVLATLFPSGSVAKLVEKRLEVMKEEDVFIEEVEMMGVVDKIVEEIITEYKNNPNFKRLPNS